MTDRSLRLRTETFAFLEELISSKRSKCRSSFSTMRERQTDGLPLLLAQLDAAFDDPTPRDTLRGVRRHDRTSAIDHNSRATLN